jgi:tetratricopeptide (TPR) repeat protein
VKFCLVATFTLAIAVLATAQPLISSLSDITALVQAGKIASAETAVRGYLQSHPDSPDAHYLLGYILFLQSKARESLAEYTQGARYRTPGASDLKVVASDYVVLSDFPDADKWFTKVIEWTPQDEQAWYDLGRTKYNENRFEEAVSAFQRALQLAPADVKAQDNLGLCYGALGKNDEAITAFRRAMDMQQGNGSKNSGPYLNMASLLIDINRDSEALPLLAQALAISPGDYRVHREFGKAYLHLNKLDQAAAELQQAIAQAPRDATLHFMLSKVYKKLNEPGKADAEIARYQELKR